MVDGNQASGLIIFDTTDDPAILDKWITIYAGTNVGYSGRADSFATPNTITILPAATSSMGTTSQYLIHERWTLREYLEALYAAQRFLNFDPQLGMGLLKEAVGREIQIGNAVVNPMFDLYTTANVPDGWTTTNLTVTQETTVTYGGARRSLKIVTDGTNAANLNQALAEVGRWQKLSSFDATARFFSETASEWFLRVNDGVDNHDSTKHTGTGWEKLTVTVTPAQLAGSGSDAMTVSIRSTTAGSTLTGYVQNVWVPKQPSDDHVYDLDTQRNLVVISPRLRVSGVFGDTGGTVGRFDHTIGPEAWDVIYEATRKLRLNINGAWNGRVVEYEGWSNHSELTAIGNTWNGPTEAILDVAAAILNAQKVAPVQVPSLARAGSPTGLMSVDEARIRALRRWGIKVPGAWKLVETIE